MTLEDRKGITPLIRRLLWEGILLQVQSTWNIPLLPVKRPHTNDYQPDQDFREVSKRVMHIHSTLPNPYTLLSMLPPEKGWYTLLDLKDAFFNLPLALSMQRYFAFEWHNPDIGVSEQLTWMRLPQGFKNSPTKFDEAIHENLSKY